MTPQEISTFINQPTPRKVSRKMLRPAADCFERRIYYIALICMAVPVYFCIWILWSTMRDMPLHFGFGGRMAAQGAIIEIESQRVLGIGPTHYVLSIRFFDGERNSRAGAFVWRRRNIPGWGVIPETQNMSSLSGTLILANPFPVNVEFTPGRHGFWVEGTRSLALLRDISSVIFSTAVIYLMYKVYMRLFPRRRVTKRLLRDGLYASGQIYRQESASPLLDMTQQRFMSNLKYAADYFVSFTDRHGMRREAPLLDVNMDNSYYSPEMLVDRPVGLLYLPDTEAVIVTDLLEGWANDADVFEDFDRVIENFKKGLDAEQLAKLDEADRQWKEEGLRNRRFDRFLMCLVIVGYIIFLLIAYTFM